MHNAPRRWHNSTNWRGPGQQFAISQCLFAELQAIGSAVQRRRRRIQPGKLASRFADQHVKLYRGESPCPAQAQRQFALEFIKPVTDRLDRGRIGGEAVFEEFLDGPQRFASRLPAAVTTSAYPSASFRLAS